MTSRASTRAAAVAARGATAELVHDGQLSGRGQGGNEVRLLEDDADLLPSQIRGLARGELGGIDVVDEDASRVGADEGGCDGKKAGLAGSAGAGDAGAGREADAVDGGDASVAVGEGEGDVVEVDHRLLPRAERGSAEVTDPSWVGAVPSTVDCAPKTATAVRVPPASARSSSRHEEAPTPIWSVQGPLLGSPGWIRTNNPSVTCPPSSSTTQ